MSDRLAFTCPHHGYVIEPTNDDGCPQCIESYTNGPDPATMTPDARVAEMERIVQCVTTATHYWWPRLDALVGRSVYIHEIGSWDELCNEARWRTGVVHVEDVIRRAPGNAIIVQVEGGTT